MVKIPHNLSYRPFADAAIRWKPVPSDEGGHSPHVPDTTERVCLRDAERSGAERLTVLALLH